MKNIKREETEKLLSANGVEIIEDSVNYWFIRTSSGTNFEKFYFNNYVAIGWDKLNNLEELKGISHDKLKEAVIASYSDDQRPGSTAAQILKFVNEVKIGDYILIPGTNCDIIAFGIVESDVYLYEPTFEDQIDSLFDGSKIDFLKRRNVKWITESPIKRNRIDPLLIPIIYSYGTIVDANPYSDYINRTLYNLYYRNGKLHSIFNIERKDNIPVYELNSFINNIFNTIDLFSQITDEEVDKEELSIKASINSPGPVEIITGAVSIMFVLSSISLFINGADIKLTFNIFNITKGELNIKSDGLIDRINKFKKMENEHEEKLAEISDEFSKSKKNLKINKSTNRET